MQAEKNNRLPRRERELSIDSIRSPMAGFTSEIHEKHDMIFRVRLGLVISYLLSANNGITSHCSLVTQFRGE